MLIKRVYEVDPLACPKCGGVMKVVAFIEPPQAEVIEKILKHCGLWQEPEARAPPCLRAMHRQADTDGLARELDASFSGKALDFSSTHPAQDFTYVDIDTFLATF